MRRLSILVVALLIGAAAPARAWCEATCAAPAESSSHCPSQQQPSTDGPAWSAATTVECPAIESARPVSAKLEIGVQPAGVPNHPAHLAPSHARRLPAEHLRALGVFDTDIPLRI